MSRIEQSTIKSLFELYRAGDYEILAQRKPKYQFHRQLICPPTQRGRA